MIRTRALQILPLLLGPLTPLSPALAAPTADQVSAEARLRGQVLLGDSVLRAGTVVLHRVSADFQGEIDSVRVARDGAFSFLLPAVPRPDGSDVYFASVRHEGILYLGRPLSLPVHLDSLYEIQAYDTLTAPSGGAPLTIVARSLFLEATEGGAWHVTDLFQLNNPGNRTWVAPAGGEVWRHPLSAGAEGGAVTQLDFAAEGAAVSGEELVVTGPLPPGERLLVVRYTVPNPFLTIPVPVHTEALEVLIKDPAPPLEVPGLAAGPPVELDAGSVFRRFAAEDVAGQTIRVVEGRRPSDPPVRGMAVALALILAGFAAWTLQSRSGPATIRAPLPPPADRRSLVLEVARLDEDFSARHDPTPEERGAYEARRRALIQRLARLG